jgi:hypothetical protein
MRTGQAMKKVFEGKTITIENTVMPINFHYGDQKELNQWITLKDKVRESKYPLIWYVIGNEETISMGRTKIDSQLILFQLTKREVLNTTRIASFC